METPWLRTKSSIRTTTSTSSHTTLHSHDNLQFRFRDMETRPLLDTMTAVLFCVRYSYAVVFSASCSRYAAPAPALAHPPAQYRPPTHTPPSNISSTLAHLTRKTALHHLPSQLSLRNDHPLFTSHLYHQSGLYPGRPGVFILFLGN